MKHLHLSPAVVSTIRTLIADGATVVEEQTWSTYPCPEPLFDGMLISVNPVVGRAIKCAVAAAKDLDRVVLMVPKSLPEGVQQPTALTAAFTVALDAHERLVSFQCVLFASRLRENHINDEVASTREATFYSVPRYEVTAWDLNNHGRSVRQPAN